MTIEALKVDSVIDAAEKLVPLLRQEARQIEDVRNLTQEVVNALEDIGVFRLRTPARYGGLDATARDMVAVARALGRGDASTAWNASVWWIPTWMAGFFERGVQDEVFGATDVRVCGTLSPGGEATPAPGGFYISGSWNFISGARHSQWQVVIVVAPSADGQSTYPLVALLPISDVEIVDDWYTGALRGSGSLTTIADKAFVPEGWTIPLHRILSPNPADESNSEIPIYSVPFSAYAASATVGTLLGVADGAVEAFEDRLRSGKGITYTSYKTASESPITHVQLAQAYLARDQATFHAARVANSVDVKGASGEEWSQLEKARARADGGEVARLVVQATTALDEASGGSSIRLDAPVQRMARDARGIAKHALIYPTTATELYGRLLCGLQPNTEYL